MRTFERHLTAIKAGELTKTNIIGLRKAFNEWARRGEGRWVGRRASSVTDSEADQLMDAIYQHNPRVTGELHDSGAKLLRGRRYAKRLARHKATIDSLAYFKLVDFDEYTPRHFTPVYTAVGTNGSCFAFRNVPWQSGGDGPELIDW